MPRSSLPRLREAVAGAAKIVSSKVTTFPSMSKALDPAKYYNNQELNWWARAIGCRTDELVAFTSLGNPTSKPIITAKQLASPPALRKSYFDYRIEAPVASLRTARAKNLYNKHEGLSDAFRNASSYLETLREKHYEEVIEALGEIEATLGQNGANGVDDLLTKNVDAYGKVKSLTKKVELLRQQAEENGPEPYLQFKRDEMDMRFPIYRHYALENWKNFDLIQLVDRLETLHVIPDTLPLLNPTQAVRIRFPGDRAYWIDPGRVLSTKVTKNPPEFEINNFSDKEDVYTILIVDPDVPDPAGDTFKTMLHYLITGVRASGNSPAPDFSDARVLASYLPPHPEKNSGTHRYCVWVFAHLEGKPLNVSGDIEDWSEILSGKRELSLEERDHFNIRSFQEFFKLKDVGAHLYRCKYDSETDNVRREFGLGTGNVWSRQRLQHY
ncbi:phosphatidylethanolamine-binding protein [Lipomyces oligophaga]|uniref:phosphatidylethanolamine-binding protein n=1 Tax=Lipomyces oligophaga TaxID=45792 RepID=UPI0034CE670E